MMLTIALSSIAHGQQSQWHRQGWACTPSSASIYRSSIRW